MIAAVGQQIGDGFARRFRSLIPQHRDASVSGGGGGNPPVERIALVLVDKLCAANVP